MFPLRALVLILLTLPALWCCDSGPQTVEHTELECPTTTTVSATDLEQLPAIKNIILFIGDGMGSRQRLAAQYKAVGKTNLLAMDDMPGQGSVCNGTASGEITDSAAAATAMATGVKTDNGFVGISPSGETLPTILEKAQRLGKATGLVTTTEITHATLAAFAAHVSDRDRLNDIADQMLDRKINVLLGGGEGEFYPEGVYGCYPQPGERSDDRNLVEEAMAAGYLHVCDEKSLADVAKAETPFLLGLFADEKMVRPYTPGLASMTRRAIEILSQDPEGFFLVVESGQIDTASHENDATNTISDTIDLNDAVLVSREFLQADERTLIIVTADHETGGMEVSLEPSGRTPDEESHFSMPDGGTFTVSWSTTGHTAQQVPLTAMGPSAEIFNGTYENTFIFNILDAVIK